MAAKRAHGARDGLWADPTAQGKQQTGGLQVIGDLLHTRHPEPIRTDVQQRGATASHPRPRGEDEWLTVDEVCRIVKIGRRTFERYLSRGAGPRVKRMGGNGVIRIRRDWLDEWMEEGTA